jgi:transposase
MLSTTELVKENTQLKKDIDQKDQRITLLEEMLRVQRHKDYGASSEKDSGQGQLFNEAEDDSLTAESEAFDIVVPAHTRKKKKRVSIPADLPREDIIHDLAEVDKVCPHDGSELTLIGEETSEQLDIEPAKIKVLRHRRQKYACPCSYRSFKPTPFRFF